MSEKKFGPILKALRESRKQSVEQLARNTKLTVSKIHALENEMYGELPSLIFVKGYVKSICGVLHEKPDVFIKALDESYESVFGNKIDKNRFSDIQVELEASVTTPILKKFLIGLAVLTVISVGVFIYSDTKYFGENPESSLKKEMVEVPKSSNTTPISEEIVGTASISGTDKSIETGKNEIPTQNLETTKTLVSNPKVQEIKKGEEVKISPKPEVKKENVETVTPTPEVAKPEKPVVAPPSFEQAKYKVSILAKEQTRARYQIDDLGNTTRLITLRKGQLIQLGGNQVIKLVLENPSLVEVNQTGASGFSSPQGEDPQSIIVPGGAGAVSLAIPKDFKKE